MEAAIKRLGCSIFALAKLRFINSHTMKGITFIAIIFMLPACYSNSSAVKPVDEKNAVRGEEIFVVSHGWHTGFVVPAKQIQNRLPKLRERFSGAPYIEFGWGDEAFYQAKETTIELVLKASLWPTESVIHAVAVPEKANEYFPNSEVIRLCLGPAEYSSLINFISNSFYKNAKGEVLHLNVGIYGDSQFYKGVGNFSLMNTCNKWTAKGLQSAGMDISPTFNLTADSVMRYLAIYKQSPSARLICR